MSSVLSFQVSGEIFIHLSSQPQSWLMKVRKPLIKYMFSQNFRTRSSMVYHRFLLPSPHTIIYHVYFNGNCKLLIDSFCIVLYEVTICIYVDMCICIYVCIYVCVYVYTYVYMYVYMYMYICAYVYMCICIYVYTYVLVYMYVYIYIYFFVCIVHDHLRNFVVPSRSVW